jgi:hypothetical protein
MPLIRKLDDMAQLPDSQLPPAVKAQIFAIREHRLWATGAASVSRSRRGLTPFNGMDRNPMRGRGCSTQLLASR